MSNKLLIQERIKTRYTNPFKTNKRINDIVTYITKWNIKDVVVGISGGIDSAFVLKLLLAAKEVKQFNIHTVFFTHGLHDNEAPKEVVDSFLRDLPVKHTTIDLNPIIQATNSVCSGVSDSVLDTQYAYALMYTLLFRKAQEVKGITFGTTNKDEFAIGWFGKTSDMVVDIQPIHDFHKHEIYSSYLTQSIPDTISGRSPNGDLLNGKTDEEVFGCTYDEVSAIVTLLEEGNHFDFVEYEQLKSVIDSNKHKLVKPKSHFNPIFL